MRALCYSVINLLTIGNAKLFADILTKKHKNLATHLKADVWHGFSSESSIDISPDLFREAFELLFNVVNTKEY